jgi:pyruvate dehydrogenase (quinone)
MLGAKVGVYDDDLRPQLIDAVVNRTELAMPPAVATEMAKGFTLYMLNA